MPPDPPVPLDELEALDELAALDDTALADVAEALLAAPEDVPPLELPQA